MQNAYQHQGFDQYRNITNANKEINNSWDERVIPQFSN